MTLFVEPSPGVPIVSMTVAFAAGAAHDPEGKEGLARATSRMIRRGGAGKSAREIEESIDALGGELTSDVQLSATTVSLEVIARNVDPFVDLVADLMAEPSFDQAEFGRLMRETEGELIDARDNDQGLASRAFRRTVYAGHVYGRRGAGRIASLRTLTPADVRGFYERAYTRANASVAVAGDVTPQRARELAEKLLARLPEGERLADPADEPPALAERRLIFVDKPGRTQTQMYIGGLGTKTSDPDHTALQVAKTIFGGTFTSRLMNEVRSKRGWSYGAYARLGFDRHREAFSMWTAPAAKDAPACLELELGLLGKWQEKGVTPRELAFTKNFLTRSHVFEIDTANKRVFRKLESEFLALPDGYYENYLARVAATTKDECDAAVRSRIDTKNLVIAVVGTHAEIGSAIEHAAGAGTRVDVVGVDFDE